MATIVCAKTKEEGETLDHPPFPNALGERIMATVSKDGWALWISHSTMLINEYRIDLASKQGTEFLLKQCEQFFFGEGSELPPEFQPEGDATSGSGETSQDS